MCDEQLQKISAIHKLFGQWNKNVPTYLQQNKAPIEPPSEPTGKEKIKPTIQVFSRPTTPLPPSPAQASRVKAMQNPPNSYPRVDIIPPTETKNTTENDTDDTDEPIDHNTQACRTTPWPWATPQPTTPTQLDHEPVAKRTRPKIDPKGP